MSTPISANDDLQLSVQLATSSGDKLTITISNQDSTTPRTFLQWDTPFDIRALDMGVLRLEDAETGDELPSPGLKLNRKLPPPRDDLIEVPAGGEVSKEIELKAPWLPTDGRKVRVRAEGEWKAAWKKGKDEIVEAELGDLGGESALTGAFRSEEAIEKAL